MTGPPRVLLVTAACFALALLLNFAYTTWALDSQLSKSCSLLRAQASSRAYPPRIRDDYRLLARQRGC